MCDHQTPLRGKCSARFEPLRELFAAKLESGEDLGAPLAVNIDGQMVVDLWDGWAGRSRWKGQSHSLRFELCQAVRRLLATEDESPHWSRRAREQFAQVRSRHAWLGPDGTTLCRGGGPGVEWWTFGGTRVNASLAGGLSRACGARVTHDAFTVTLEGLAEGVSIEGIMTELRSCDPGAVRPEIDEAAVEGLKFSRCLPPDLAVSVLASRLADDEGVRDILGQPIRVVSMLKEIQPRGSG